MKPIETHARRGVTLVELLVVMAVLTTLAALALMIVPSVVSRDNTLKGTADVQSALQIAQGMAAADKLPRGVRLISPSSAAGAGSSIVTELQYLEAPPILVPTPLVMVGDPYNQAYSPPAQPYNPPIAVGKAQDAFRPQIQFVYDLNPAPTGTATTPLAGSVAKRHCLIVGLTADQAVQVTDGATIILPTLNSFSQISDPTGTGIITTPATATTPLILEVPLAVYPDAALGAGSQYRTYDFGIYGPPRPLLGEPTIELPLNSGVDLALCLPIGTAGQNYDIMFAPSGQRITTKSVPGSSSQVFLWVRDYTKVASMIPTSGYPSSAPNAWVFNQNQFLQGGEQQIVGIRAAAIGGAPVLWPTAGTYTAPQDPYSFARDKLTGQ